MAQTLEQAFAATVAQIKQQLSEANVSHFCFRLEAEGRPDGDIRLSVQIGQYAPEVTGRGTAEVLNEWLRRQGWNARNDPLELPDYSATRADL